jgi:sigma-B regulation protein RsbU (phosphoserine phosphatase)
VEYGRAGHNPIVWRRARRGETVLVKPNGIGLGLAGSEQFGRSLRLERLELEPGDAVILYSDGVTEAVNDTLDQFGEERLIRAVEQADGRSADETKASILRELAAFTGSTPAWDDITLVALRVDDSTRSNHG